MYYRKLADVVEKIGDVIDNYYGFIYDFKPYKDSREIYCNSIYTTVCSGKKIDIGEKNMRLDTIPSGEYVCIAFNWSAKIMMSIIKSFINILNLTASKRMEKYIKFLFQSTITH